MATSPTTPRRQASSSANPTTPATTRVTGSHLIQSSPHYQTTRRHSLYGTEDRVVIDPGSRIWKVGFSGEATPRDVLYADGESGESLWGLRRATEPVQRGEEDRTLEVRLEKSLRSVFHSSLLTDPKSRKVILVEDPLLPLHVKDLMARILFENLQVPSISFASSHLLSLFAAGRITGLVLDCGHQESVALPIFAARPLYPQLRSTPLAGSRLSSHLRALLLLFGTYLPPPTTLSGAANIPAASRAMRVPEEVVTDAVIEDIKTRCCFVAESMDAFAEDRESSPSGDDSMEIEVPPSDTTQSESEFSHLSSNLSSQQHSSEFSVVSSHTSSRLDTRQNEGHLQSLATLYKRHSTATDLQMKVMPPVSQQTGTGRGILIVPGWVRERAAEVLFEGGDVDESSVAEVILDALLKVPVDLRKTIASSILIVGGTAMLPGFISRLHTELHRAVAHVPSSSRHAVRPDKPVPPPYDRYAPLRPLMPYFAVLNNPVLSPSASDLAGANGGKAPAFSPATMAWVGGSLAGSLKTGGTEVPREKWDESEANRRDDDESMDVVDPTERPAKSILPDWTRTPLPAGAPPAVAHLKQTQVGA